MTLELLGVLDYRAESLINAPSGFPYPSLAVAEVISHFGASSRLDHSLQLQNRRCQLQISEEELLFWSGHRFHVTSPYPDNGVGNGGVR